VAWGTRQGRSRYGPRTIARPPAATPRADPNTAPRAPRLLRAGVLDISAGMRTPPTRRCRASSRVSPWPRRQNVLGLASRPNLPRSAGARTRGQQRRPDPEHMPAQRAQSPTHDLPRPARGPSRRATRWSLSTTIHTRRMPHGAAVPHTCGTPPASLGAQLASIRLQSAVSLVVDVTLLTGSYGLLAAVIRRRAGRRSRRGHPDTLPC